MQTSRALKPALRLASQFLLLGGLVLLILGIRIFVGARFLSPLPQIDDWGVVAWLHNWANGIHDWSRIWMRNNDHPMELYYLAILLQYHLNGYWDSRLDFLAGALAHAVYALVIFLTFRDILGKRDRNWMTGFIFFLFAVPFAGYRINWGIIWPHSAMMTFDVLALYFAVYYRDTWVGVVVAVAFAFLGSLNMAAGCLGAFMVGAVTLFHGALVRRIAVREVILAAAGLLIFASYYFTMQNKGTSGAGEVIDALMKALAWPVVFASPAGLCTLIPLLGFGLALIIYPSFRTRNLEFVLGVSGLVFLMAVATGVERGANQNMGMPSGRYTEVFLLVPLVIAVILCALYRRTEGRLKTGWAVFAWIWIAVQVFGFSVHLIYRTLPFIARENGEWVDASRQVLFRDLSRGVSHPSPPQSDRLWTDALGIYGPPGLAASGQPIPALTLPMLVGFPIFVGSQGNYVSGGYLPSYQPRPGQIYRGSFDPDHREITPRWFQSASFEPTAPYITIDLIVDKKARFTNYRLEGLEVILDDETTGRRLELLPRLARSFPFVLRDWEAVYARVVPGHRYRIESYTTDPQSWIALGEPFESGAATPFIMTVMQSGKLMCLCGLELLTLYFALGFFGGMFEEAPEARTPKA